MTDIAALARTHARAFADDRGWTEAELRDLLADDKVILSGDARAFVLGRLALDECEILTVATDPDHRRQGLARAALNDLLTAAKAKGAATVFLEVAEDNTPARALYDRAGFAAVGRRRGYYRRADGNVDALVLQLTL